MNSTRSRRPLLTLAALCGLALCIPTLDHPGPAEARKHTAAAPTAAPTDPQPLVSTVPATTPPTPDASAPTTPTASTTPIDSPSETPTGTASEAPEGRHHRRRAPAPPASPSPSPTPTSPAFSTLEGEWLVVVQTPSSYSYSRFDLHQDADTITGVWTRDGKKLPLSGTYGGRQFKFTVKNDPHDLTLTGYVENAADMVGIIDDGSGKDGVAFTASHRAIYHPNILPKRGEKRGT